MHQLSQEERAGIERLFQTYAEAWARRDAKACAALYAADADALAIDGELLTSPVEIQRYYERQLSGPYKDYTISDVELGAMRALTPDITIQNGTWLLHGVKGRARPVRVRGTFLCRRDPIGWRYVALRLMVPFEGGAQLLSATA